MTITNNLNAQVDRPYMDGRPTLIRLSRTMAEMMLVRPFEQRRTTSIFITSTSPTHMVQASRRPPLQLEGLARVYVITLNPDPSIPYLCLVSSSTEPNSLVIRRVELLPIPARFEELNIQSRTRSLLMVYCNITGMSNVSIGLVMQP